MSAITLTLCDRAENHVGMEQIGTLCSEGFLSKDLNMVKKKLDEYTEIFKLKCIEEDGIEIEVEEADILIIKDGVNL